MYSIWGSLKHGYYLQTRNTMVRLISCLPNSNRNSVGEYMRVSGNWLDREMTCPTSSRQLGRCFFYRSLCTPNRAPIFSYFLSHFFLLLTYLLLFTLHFFHCLSHLLLTFTTFPTIDSKKFQPDIRVVRVKELNFILHSEIFVQYDDQLQASYLILGCIPFYTSYQDSSQALIVSSPLLSYLDIRLPGFLPKGLTYGEARHLGPQLVKYDSLEPIQDGSGDSIFQGQLGHIPVEASPPPPS